MPVDGDREAGQQHHHRLRIRRVDLLDELLLLQVDGLAVDGLLAVARRGALGPAGVAGGMVADEDHGDIGFLRGFDGPIDIGRGRVVDLDPAAGFLLQALERRDRT
jgi:hypothetical protein